MKKVKKQDFVYLREVEFKVNPNKSAIICINSSVGIDRIVIENVNGVVNISVTSHNSRFKFSRPRKTKKEFEGTCDFFLDNPHFDALLSDYLLHCFWGQFNWGELLYY